MTRQPDDISKEEQEHWERKYEEAMKKTFLYKVRELNKEIDELGLELAKAFKLHELMGWLDGRIERIKEWVKRKN